MTADDKQPLIDSSNGSVPSHDTKVTGCHETKVYKRRWWVLGIFVVNSCIQSMAWNTWGPITKSAEEVFGWTDSTIGLLVNLGNISFVTFVMPLSWIMDEKGLRVAMLISTTCLVVSTGLRCITLDPTPLTWFAGINSVSDGISGSVAYAAPALVSNTWFPPNQRATATALGTFFVFMGIGMSFILGPQVVRSPVYAYYNETTATDRLIIGIDDFEIIENSSTPVTVIYKNVTNIDDLKSDIKHLLYIHLGMAAFCFVCVVLYFPRKPPLPPSKTASIGRIEYKTGLKQLAGNGPAWMVVIANSFPIGIIGVWGPVLGVNLKQLDVTQTDAGWMGFWMTFAGCSSGLLLARFNDLFKRRMKLFLILLLLGGMASSLWFTILCSKYISFNLVSLYAASVLAGTFINATIPLFFELSCEAAFPVAEGLTGGFLTFFQNLVGVFFLLLLFIPSIGKSWMNWALVASCLIALPLVCVFPEKYRRTDIDLNQEADVSISVKIESNTPNLLKDTNTEIVPASKNLRHKVVSK